MSLYGVEAGRESEVFHEVETAIEDVNGLRQNARHDRERSRPTAEAGDALAERRLEAVTDVEAVTDGFHAARESGATFTTTSS
ncbi:MAG TPA: hypothetical protein VG106_05185, partial [Vicinamibacterales bacterium]|nr:hypothetical protein [Vicinamibacterales bacterium]